MYLKLAIDDEGLVRQLAQLLRHESSSDCAPDELALLFSVQEAYEWREASFIFVKHQLADGFERRPAHTLMKLKTTVQRMSHRLVELDDATSILISSSNQDSGRLTSVGMFEKLARMSTEANPKIRTTVLGTTELKTFVAGMQNAATRKIADAVLQGVNDASDFNDLLGDADLPTLVYVAQALWNAQRDGGLTARKYEQIASKLFQVSGMRILQASAVFTIPGIGPGLAALLFAHRIERLR